MSAQELQKIVSPKFTENVLKDMVTKKSGLSDVVVTKIEMGASSKKGDSYLSDLCRFTLNATGKNKKNVEESVSIPVIVKFLPTNVARRKTYRGDEFFENEIIFYEKVWGPMQKFQEEAGIVEKFEDIPLVLSAYADGVNDYVAMYDLGHDGYRSAERGAGLEREYTVAILGILARFHALSLAFKEKQPEVFEKAATSLKETYFSERLRPWYSNFQQNVFKVVRDAVSKELDPKYLKKLNNILDNDLMGLLIRSCVVRGPLSVITHGDVWVPNFLFQFEENTNKLKNVKMIDFQLARYTTLVTDVAFFLFSCVSPDLIETQWDELVADYHRTLVDSMKKYGCKNFVDIEDIHKELKEHSIMGVGMSMEALIMAQLEDDEISDLDAIKGDQAVPLETVWLIHPFKDQARRQRIARMVKIAADKNFI